MARDEHANALWLLSLVFKSRASALSFPSSSPLAPAVEQALASSPAEADELEQLVRSLGKQLRGSNWVEEELSRQRASGKPLVQAFAVAAEATAAAQAQRPPTPAASAAPEAGAPQGGGCQCCSVA
jgi:hypothetical protein